MSVLTLDRIQAARRERFATALLYLTDRCPVGCAHCSVDSRPFSPRPTDLPLLERLLTALCERPGLRIVGVSGGEPFVERRALGLAARHITGSGRQLVVYTSGVWASGDRPAPWIREVLAAASCVVLSTDAFHARRLPADRFAAAARAVVAQGAHLAVQVLDDAAQVANATALLSQALGPRWREVAEVGPVPLLPFGRAARLPRTPPPAGRPGRSYGRCPVADAPVVRYDGTVLGCCNEDVTTGSGPQALRRHARTREEAAAALDELANDPYLKAVSRAGLGALTRLPRYQDLAGREFGHGCALCWRMLDERDPGADPAVHALAALPGGPR